MAIQQQIEEKDWFQEKFFFSLLKFENSYLMQHDDDSWFFLKNKSFNLQVSSGLKESPSLAACLEKKKLLNDG